MVAALRRTPSALMVVTLAVGVAACWSTGTLFGVLAPLGALFLYARGYWLLTLWIGLLIAFSASVIAALLYPGSIREAALSLGALAAVAACIGLLLVAGPLRRSNRLTAPQRQEPGQPEGLGPAPAPGAIHPDDRAAIAHAAAYAFWTGVPQVMGYRLRQLDGSYHWTELRAEPGYGVSVDVDAMISRPDDRWTVAESLERLSRRSRRPR